MIPTGGPGGQSEPPAGDHWDLSSLPNTGADRLGALGSFARRALRQRDIDRLLADAARVCVEQIDVGFAAILEYQPASGQLRLRGGAGWDAEALGSAIIDADATNPASEAFLTRSPVIVADIARHPYYRLPEFLARERIVSIASVPLHAGPALSPSGDRDVDAAGRFGVLEVSDARGREFGKDEISFMTAIAGILGEAIAEARDREALRRQTEAAAALAADRQVYLREIQHRIRNDLQLVQSLASHHLRQAASDASRSGFEAIGRRVLALAALYDHLLGVGMSRRVDFGEYLRDLCAKIANAEDLPARGIVLAAKVEPLELDIDSAASLGIAANELIANAAEHAFDGSGGRVTVRLERGDSRQDQSAILTIADDGRGFVECADTGNHGIRLVRHLVRRAGAELSRESGSGTTWRIVLGPEPFTAGRQPRTA